MERNPDGHSPDYWKKHPEAQVEALRKKQQAQKQQAQNSQTVTSRPVQAKRIAYLRTIGFVSLVLAFGTFVMESYFWEFVALSYLGLVVASADTLQESELGRFRYVVFTFFVLIILFFTFNFVIPRLKPTIRSQWNQGNYPAGSNIHGLQWANGYSELRIYFENQTNVDFNDYDTGFVIEEDVAQIKSMSEYCTILGSTLEILGTDSTGRQMIMGGNSQKFKYRLLCPKLPAHASVAVIAAVTDTNDITLTKKRKPDWIRFEAQYRAKGRPYSINDQIVPN